MWGISESAITVVTNKREFEAWSNKGGGEVMRGPHHVTLVTERIILDRIKGVEKNNDVLRDSVSEIQKAARSIVKIVITGVVAGCVASALGAWLGG